MTGRPELNGQPILDDQVSEIRALIEARFVGGVDKNGAQLGLKVRVGDVPAACSQVAYENPFHPVREYLAGLEWDGVPRLDSVAEDLLGAERSELHQALVRRFFIGAVARAIAPGCKVDTVLILVGKQGAMKSSFFRALASPAWFLDSPIDISKKDAYEQLRTAWIVEWAELESLMRARDSVAVKAFITSARDTYRPSYGRFAVDVPRSSVIVGTTNQDEFLTDDTGNRRFWPMVVGDIDLDATAAQRDQLWAEALALYRAGQQWWLTEAEESQLTARHAAHEVQDAWSTPIAYWADLRTSDFAVADVLGGPLDKPKGQWSRADEMRVARVLKQLGFQKWKSHGRIRWKR